MKKLEMKKHNTILTKKAKLINMNILQVRK